MLVLFLTLIKLFVVSPEKYPTFHESVIEGRKYNKLVSPFEHSRQTTNISLSVPFVILVSVSESRQVVSYIAASWYDSRLAFDREKFGYDHVVVPSHLLWIPEVETFNSVELKFLDKESHGSQVQVHHSGSVFMFIKGKFDTVCRCNVAAFPFDTQYCNLDFDTGLTPITEERLHGYNHTEVYMGLPEWDLGPPLITNSIITSLEGKQFSIVIASFEMKRNPQFYIWFLIVPTFTITLTCITALLLPLYSGQGERVSLGTSGLLGLTFMLGVIVHEVPRSTELPLMGKWLIVQMFFCVAGMMWEAPNYMLLQYLQGRLSSTETKTSKKSLRLWAGYIAAFVFVLSDTIFTLFLFGTAGQPPRDPDKLL